MKTLIIGGNRFVGLRLARLLDAEEGVELHVLNRSGSVPGVRKAVVHKGSRDELAAAGIGRDWDVVYNFSCYNLAQARGAVEFFGRVGKFIFISTGSVYDAGRSQGEEGFNPRAWEQHETPNDTEMAVAYQFGKRQAEAAFAQEAKFPTLLVRLPFIAGPDDYTRRFAFHVERVAKGLPIFFPDIAARTSLADSEDAARFLHWCLRRDLSGPLNVASPEDIALEDLVARIEARLGRKAVIARHETDECRSPYGIPETRSLDVSRMLAAGFATRPFDSWMPALIDACANP